MNFVDRYFQVSPHPFAFDPFFIFGCWVAIVIINNVPGQSVAYSLCLVDNRIMPLCRGVSVKFISHKIKVNCSISIISPLAKKQKPFQIHKIFYELRRGQGVRIGRPAVV
jgi:hypothetical protein